MGVYSGYMSCLLTLVILWLTGSCGLKLPCIKRENCTAYFQPRKRSEFKR